MHFGSAFDLPIGQPDGRQLTSLLNSWVLTSYLASWSFLLLKLWVWQCKSSICYILGRILQINVSVETLWIVTCRSWTLTYMINIKHIMKFELILIAEIIHIIILFFNFLNELCGTYFSCSKNEEKSRFHKTFNYEFLYISFIGLRG